MVLWFVVHRRARRRAGSCAHPAVLAARQPAARGALLRSTTAGTASSCSARSSWSVTGGEALYADMGHFGQAADPARLVRAGAAGAAAQLLRPGRAAARRPGGGRATRSSCWRRRWALYPAGRAGDGGDGHRLAGADLRRLLAHPAGGAARLHARACDIVHTSAREIGQIYIPAVNWAADARLHRPGARLPHVEQPRRGLRHRGDDDDGDHHVLLAYVVARERWGWSRAGGGAADRRSSSSSTSPSSAPTCVKIPHGGWFPLRGRRRGLHADDDLEAGPAILAERLRERTPAARRASCADVERDAAARACRARRCS